jgi:hypothetical protein
VYYTFPLIISYFFHVVFYRKQEVAVLVIQSFDLLRTECTGSGVVRAMSMESVGGPTSTMQH